jgi:hypothetical protein
MSSLSATSAFAAAILLGVTLGGCSENYFDRRDTVTLYSGEAMAANRVTHTIDPWSAASGRRNIAYNGEKAASASERYRTGKVIAPVNALTSTSYQAAAQAQSNNQSAPSSNAGGNNSNGSIK